MAVDKNELLFAKAFLQEHFGRITDWAIGDIQKCCRMNADGSCAEGGALVGAFILWCCAIEYFGGLYTGYTSQGSTKARFKFFIEKYMSRYDPVKVEELRWSLTHYYSPHHFVLYHENNFEENKTKHLVKTERGILLHLGWAVKDLAEAVENYSAELNTKDSLMIKAWRYYKEQLPIMPFEIENLPIKTHSSTATGAIMKPFLVSGTIGPEEWFNK